MNKHVMTILRVLVAAAGITYIIYSLTWTDHVAVPADHAIAQAHHLQPHQALRVVSGDINATDPAAKIVLKVEDGSGAAATETITAGDLDTLGGPLGAQPGIGRTLAEANVGLLLLGLLAAGPIYVIIALRWWVLMRARGLDVTPWKAFRLSMVGCFFNYCMPGTTGGDLVKAYYAARGSGRKADAVVSVVVDRAVGLLGLFTLAGVAGLFMFDNPVARQVTLYIWGGVACLVLGASVYFSHTLRRFLKLERWLFRMPGGSLLRTIDEAAVAYRNHKRAILTAVLLASSVHLCLAMSTALAGYALGMQRPLGLLLTVVPILFMGAAVPISYQGLGIMEAIGKPMLVGPGFTFNQMAGMLLLIRLFQILYSLGGAAFVLKGDIHMHPEAEEVQGAKGNGQGAKDGGQSARGKVQAAEFTEPVASAPALSTEL